MRLSLQSAAAAPAARAARRSPLTHAVLFQAEGPQPGGRGENRPGAAPAWRARSRRCKLSRSASTSSPLARAYDIALITRFASLADMELYQVHPIHQEVLAHMRAVMEASVAVDFEGNE
jgi:hypothetical protein